jgi:hypothetical protein
VIEIAAKLAPTGYRFGDLVLAITDSDPFLKKRLLSESKKPSDEK